MRFELTVRLVSSIGGPKVTDLPWEDPDPNTVAGLLRSAAGWLAGRRPVPTPVRAVAGYYADTGEFDPRSLRLNRTVDLHTEAMLSEVFGLVESAIAETYDTPEVTFGYDTKLILPAQLTLGELYRTARERAPPGADPVELSVWADRGDGEREADAPSGWERRLPAPDERLDPQQLVDRGDALTRLVIQALIDGDMRDAVNDAEYEDFEVSLDLSPDERARVAELAQETLQADLESAFETVPDAVRDHYEWAVEHSEAHQMRDPHFRELYASAREGGADAAAAIREQYRNAPFEVDTDVFAGEADLPYLSTQYARVGVIYDGMVEMYRAAGLPVDTAFKRSIVLAIVGAQIWLDDVDDFADDVAEGQLTPVTAEFVLAEDERTAHEQVCSITERYLDRAKESAAATDSPLTGIATEYIYRSGDPSLLPGNGPTDRPSTAGHEQ